MIRLLLAVLAVLALSLLLPAAAIAQEPAADETVAEEPAEVAEDEEAPDVVKLQQEVYWAPPGAGNDEWTWIKLKSGEWQRGEIKDLHDGTLTFDSDELDEFTYDWDKVRAVISGRPHTITTWDRDVYTGFLVARSGEIRVLDAEGETITALDPDDVSGMIQGNPRERNFWSGEIGLGTTIRTGNSDQTDGTATVALNRRALTLRWDNLYTFSYATSQGAKTQETHRYTSAIDRYLDRHWFVTLAQYEFFRDPFQNIEQRHTPGAGVGHERKHSGLDWSATAGLAWQSVNYVSVQADQSSNEQGVAGSLGADVEWDITKDTEFDVMYSISFPFRAPSGYSSHATVALSLDLFRALDLDLTLYWDRQNKPREAEDGTLPKKDDLRFTTGVSWAF